MEVMGQLPSEVVGLKYMNEDGASAGNGGTDGYTNSNKRVLTSYKEVPRREVEQLSVVTLGCTWDP